MTESQNLPRPRFQNRRQSINTALIDKDAPWRKEPFTNDQITELAQRMLGVRVYANDPQNVLEPVEELYGQLMKEAIADKWTKGHVSEKIRNLTSPGQTSRELSTALKTIESKLGKSISSASKKDLKKLYSETEHEEPEKDFDPLPHDAPF